MSLKHRIKTEPISDDDDDERHAKFRVKRESDLSRVKPDPDGDNRGHHRSRYRDRHRGHGSEDRHRGHDLEDLEERKPVAKHIKRERHDAGYIDQTDERRRNDDRRRDNYQRRENFLEEQRYGREEASATSQAAQPPKAGPDFELSGKLTEDTNTYKGVVIKYNEPPEARKPRRKWRLYPFKNDEALKPYHMHRQSAFLLGRDRIVADIPIDHPSCSKQHAVFQYRMVEYQKEDGRKARKVAPYIIDLGSANGTYVNNKQIEAQRYVELMEKDVIKFGYSSREYVLLHDNSDTTELDEDSS